MHFVMIVGSLVLAWSLRYGWQNGQQNFDWAYRWQKALICYVLPPLLVIMTAISVLCMGAEGQMIGLQAGRMSYAIAAIFLIYSLLRIGQLAWQGWQSLRHLENLVIDPVDNTSIELEISSLPMAEPIKLLNLPISFAAQIGFWRSHLFVSKSLLENLDASHLEAVLLHERAHAHYRDTFWFFWLGCLRQIIPWLPNTQDLWEELLLLRELRADRWAAQHLDGLLLAESLLTMVSSNMQPVDVFAAAFGASASDRLEERINFLLAEPESLPQLSWQSFCWLGLSLMPLTLLPFHENMQLFTLS